MDMPGSQIIFIDYNEASQHEQILSRIIAAALLDKLLLHNNIQTSTEVNLKLIQKSPK